MKTLCLVLATVACAAIAGGDPGEARVPISAGTFWAAAVLDEDERVQQEPIARAAADATLRKRYAGSEITGVGTVLYADKMPDIGERAQLAVVRIPVGAEGNTVTGELLIPDALEELVVRGDLLAFRGVYDGAIPAGDTWPIRCSVARLSGHVDLPAPVVAANEIALESPEGASALPRLTVAGVDVLYKQYHEALRGLTSAQAEKVADDFSTRWGTIVLVGVGTVGDVRERDGRYTIMSPRERGKPPPAVSAVYTKDKAAAALNRGDTFDFAGTVALNIYSHRQYSVANAHIRKR